MCLACALGKRKKSSHQPKAEETNQEKLYLLHMDLYGPMRIESINGKKYILVIVDDYSRFTWVKFLRSKDEAPDAIIKCIKNIQVSLNATAEAINTGCYTQNCSLIRLRYNKTPYELMHDKKPDLLFLYVFGSLYYPTNDSEDLGKLNANADLVPIVVAPRAVEIVSSPSSTTIDQDAPSSSTLSTNQQQQSSVISQGVEEPIPNELFDDPCHEPLQDVSTSQESSSNVQSSHSPLELIKPKNFKEAMLEFHGLRQCKKKFMNLKDYKFEN
ncbi:retrovirus-related pol polyprotein from transposon TNT 1-94 [Tanacetum coccineum]